MRTHIHTPLRGHDEPDCPPTLHLRAQTAQDRYVLSRLVASYQIRGFGRDSETRECEHLSLELKPT